MNAFFLQETKMTPPVKGYDIKKRHREQLKEKENNLFGIKETIPFTEIKNEMRGPGDKITEWYTVEIPTGKKKNIKITNMYIPPIRQTQAERERQRRYDISTDKWPDKQEDILIGDFNAHSSIWDDAVITKPELFDKRAEVM